MTTTKLDPHEKLVLTEEDILEIRAIKQENVWYDWNDVKAYLKIKDEIEDDVAV
ncbi:MAG: hypothetical protein PHF46_05185 [Candidatus Gracilibacteria bacterium]|nr:hypothetical protein [Candidatus Gracilibacteria bacterium]